MVAAEEHKEPPYMIVFGVLAVLTVLEVLFAFTSLPKFWLAIGLIVMAVWKAVLVALYYMHLRFEPKRLWVVAASPIPLAIILIIVVIQEF
ncbi:MAG: cytochrome C oxidase subunit IV family protein [Chloroflexi bacterium]|nr:cytochrome C oxidase subunit IV family protein [Chloroflexota bacterium]